MQTEFLTSSRLLTWSGRNGEEEKGGGAKGQGGPLRHNEEEGNGTGMGRGKGAASRGRGTEARSSSKPARTCVQWVSMGRCGQSQERAWGGDKPLDLI